MNSSIFSSRHYGWNESESDIEKQQDIFFLLDNYIRIICLALMQDIHNAFDLELSLLTLDRLKRSYFSFLFNQSE